MIRIVEAEAFADRGGWTVDAQHIDQMGSSYLLAHGLGRPVADAVTRVSLGDARPRRLWVRTRDWFAPGAPGRFQVLLNGAVLGTFGNSGSAWHWSDAGVVQCPASVELRLRDLTGFDGRVDAICFSDDLSAEPPNDRAQLERLRAASMPDGDSPKEIGSFDLVVCGGGVAGTCAALTAARLGLSVALIQNRPLLGGNNSSEIRVHLSSKRNIAPWPALGSVVGEMERAAQRTEPAEGDRFAEGDAQKRALVEREERITLLSNCHVVQAECSAGRIAAVVVQDVISGQRRRISAPLFVDATGDGNLAVAAGATWRMGRESQTEFGEHSAPDHADGRVLGSTLHWYSRPVAQSAGFPDITWGIPFDAEREQKAHRSAWNWESGFDCDQIADAEWVRDNLLAAIYGNWSYQVNRSAERARYASFELAWVGHVLGKRESRRIQGDLTYNQGDLLREAGLYDDELVPCDWGVDIHVPAPANASLFGIRAFRARSLHHDRVTAQVRVLPYRCLYARDVDNLLLAGRCASTSHVAHAWFRCQRTTGMMGEVVGKAAAICAERGCNPRDVYTHHLARLKEMVSDPNAAPAPV